MGRDYPDEGFEQGRAVLMALAKNPATAKHIATKLARHSWQMNLRPRWLRG